MRDDAAAALRRTAELDARYPSVVDTGGELWQALDVPLAIPTTYVLGSDGSLQRVDPPIVLADAEEVEATVRAPPGRPVVSGMPRRSIRAVDRSGWRGERRAGNVSCVRCHGPPFGDPTRPMTSEPATIGDGTARSD